MFTVVKKTYGEDHNRVIIIIPGFGAKQWHLWLLGKLFASYNYKAIIFTYDTSILSPDINQTKENFDRLYLEVKKTVTSLPKREQNNLSLFAMSIGAIPGIRIANELKEIKSVILNLIGADFPESVWSWEKGLVKGYKEELEKKNVSLEKLHEAWDNLSPRNHVSHWKKKQTLVYLATEDEIFPFSKQEALLRLIQQPGDEAQAIVNTRHNHLVSAIINLLNFTVYLRFLQREKRS